MSPPHGEADRELEPALVSTGSLPTAAQVEALVAEAHERYREDASGATSSVYPALARADPGLFGVCVIGMSGNVYGAGDTEVEFSIMSVAKPFVFALVCDLLGPDEVWQRIGVNSTGLPFDSLAAVERSADGRTNPMVNSGAIATTSLLPGATPEDKWHFLCEGLSRFAGRSLSIADDVYRSASETNMRNRSIAFLLRARDRIYCDPLEALDLYTRQSSLSVTARDLAVMGATLADGGVNPITGEQVIDAVVVPADARGDDHRRPLRDLGQLALQGRTACQERHRGRHRRRLPRQGRPRHVRPAAGRRRKQCQGPARSEVPVASAGPAYPRVGTPDALRGSD